MKNQVKILGTNYKILEQDESENQKLKVLDASGLCESFAKEIIIRKLEDDLCNYKNFDEYRKKVLRHEIVHAFFMESGLIKYMEDEELVDWIALQFSKMHRAMCEADCLEKIT